MISTLLFVRFLKFVSVAAFFAGMVGTFSAKTPEERRRWSDRHAAPGFVLTWVCGFAMSRMTGHSLVAGWVVGAAVASTVCIWCVLAQAHMRSDKAASLSGLASLSFI